MHMYNLGLEIIKHFKECICYVSYAYQTFERFDFIGYGPREIYLCGESVAFVKADILRMVHGKYAHLMSGIDEHLTCPHSHHAVSSTGIEKFVYDEYAHSCCLMVLICLINVKTRPIIVWHLQNKKCRYESEVSAFLRNFAS